MNLFSIRKARRKRRSDEVDSSINPSPLSKSDCTSSHKKVKAENHEGRYPNSHRAVHFSHH